MPQIKHNIITGFKSITSLLILIPFMQSQICSQILVFKLTEEALAKCLFFLLGNKFTFSLTLDQSHLGPVCIFLLPLAETMRSLPCPAFKQFKSLQYLRQDCYTCLKSSWGYFSTKIFPRWLKKNSSSTSPWVNQQNPSSLVFSHQFSFLLRTLRVFLNYDHFSQIRSESIHINTIILKNCFQQNQGLFFVACFVVILFLTIL